MKRTIEEIMNDPQPEDRLAALFRRMDKLGWPKYEDDPELCMARARQFLDAAKVIYPNA
jgi:hypothetical protein